MLVSPTCPREYGVYASASSLPIPCARHAPWRKEHRGIRICADCETAEALREEGIEFASSLFGGFFRTRIDTRLPGAPDAASAGILRAYNSKPRRDIAQFG